MHRNTIDRKGILAYLFITFGITYAIEFALVAAGFRQFTRSPSTRS